MVHSVFIIVEQVELDVIVAIVTMRTEKQKIMLLTVLGDVEHVIDVNAMILKELEFLSGL